MSQTRGFLDKAERSLRAAERNLKEGDCDFAASHAYYACFYVAEALLATEGARFSSHGQIADYQVEVEIKPEVVQELIEGGRSFLAAASQYLKEPSGAGAGEVAEG